YTVTKRRRLDAWTLYLLVPVVALAAYHLATGALYGRGLLGDAAAYATDYRARHGIGLASGALTGLSFAGGGLAGLALYAPLAWPRRALLLGAAGVALATLLLPYVGTIGPIRLNDADGVRWLLLLHLGVFAGAGVHLIALAVLDAASRRDGE